MTVAEAERELGDEQADHLLGLPGAHIVATDALLLTKDNLTDVLAAKAMATPAWVRRCR